MNLTRLSANIIWSSSVLSFAFSTLALLKILLLEVLVRTVQNNPDGFEKFLPFFDHMFNPAKNGAAVLVPVFGILAAAFLYLASKKFPASKWKLAWGVSVFLLGAFAFQLTPLFGLLTTLGGILAICDSREIRK